MNKQYELIIATDLDGTFLEGDAEIKNVFYNELIRLREKVMLIYTTGRSVDVVERFCRRGYLPYPHFLIADHGTHIVDGTHFQIVEDLQNPIIENWNKGNERIKNMLQHDKGIQLQPIDPPYRVAYYYDPNHLQVHTLQKIDEAGYDAILSCDAYLDIVPRGVNKGTTLLELLNTFNLEHHHVITCGDSLNDLSLFQTGLKSIAVGNSEPNLIKAIQDLPNAYISQHPGILGIIDGLSHYGKIELLNQAA